jgi:hypothetical protein
VDFDRPRGYSSHWHPSVRSVAILGIQQAERRGEIRESRSLAHFSPYPKSKVKRFGYYPAQVITDSRPIQKNLPVSSVSMAAL